MGGWGVTQSGGGASLGVGGAGEGLVKMSSCFGHVKIVVKLLQENLCRALKLGFLLFFCCCFSVF